MRVKVVRTPGELRDEIGHRIVVRKDWVGTVLRELVGDEIALAGFHPKRSVRVAVVRFDVWEQSIAIPWANLVEIGPGEVGSIGPDDDEYEDDDE